MHQNKIPATDHCNTGMFIMQQLPTLCTLMVSSSSLLGCSTPSYECSVLLVSCESISDCNADRSHSSSFTRCWRRVTKLISTASPSPVGYTPSVTQFTITTRVISHHFRFQVAHYKVLYKFIFFTLLYFTLPTLTWHISTERNSKAQTCYEVWNFPVFKN